MKQLILISCTLFYTIQAISQNNRLNFSVFGGASFPTGKFHSTKYNDRTSGYAKNGWSLSTEINYQCFKQFGILAQYQFEQNAVNTKAMSLYAPPNGSYFSGFTINVTSDQWKIHSLLLGVYYSLKLTNQLYFDIAIKAGELKSASPKTKEENIVYSTVYTPSTGIGNDTTYTFIMKSEIPIKWNLEYSATGKLKYQFSKKMILLAALDYVYSNPTLTAPTFTYRTYSAAPWGTTPETNGTLLNLGPSTYKQKISAINFSLGVQLNINHQ